MAGNNYTIKKNRISKGLVTGFEYEGETCLRGIPEEDRKVIVLRSIDGARDGATWGRLWFDLELEEEMACYIYAFAVDQDSFYRRNMVTKIDDFMMDPLEPYEIKEEFISKLKYVYTINQKDILLYNLKGRYLHLVFAVLGQGECKIDNIRLDSLGDNFMSAFPEVYRQQDGFFRRFLSVFSSIYNDFGEDIEHLPELLDLDTAPVELLPIYGSWLGVDTGADILDEKVLRELVKQAYDLCRIKGTREAVKRVSEIVLQSEVILLEHNVIMEYVTRRDEDLFRLMYGDSGQDVTLLIRRKLDSGLRSKLMYILEQFIPIRTKVRLVELLDDSVCDSYCYLDINASIRDVIHGTADEGYSLDNAVVLS